MTTQWCYLAPAGEALCSVACVAADAGGWSPVLQAGKDRVCLVLEPVTLNAWLQCPMS